MNLIWEITFKIAAFDVDANNKLKVSRIFDYFQDAASNDAERRGFGYNKFVPMGLFWVLSWVRIEFLRFPKFMDEIKIQTWGKKQHKLYSIRDFYMLNSNNEVIVKGTSAWLLLDSKTLKLKILTRIFPEFTMLESKEALTDLPQKIISQNKVEIIYSKKIGYSDIDLNQHTNNAKYIDLLFDCFDQNFHKEHSVKSLIVSFNAETKFGDEIELYKGSPNSNLTSHYVEAKNKNSGNTVFQALVNWL